MRLHVCDDKRHATLEKATHTITVRGPVVVSPLAVVKDVCPIHFAEELEKWIKGETEENFSYEIQRIACNGNC